MTEATTRMRVYQAKGTVRSLAWRGEDLVDLAGGGTIFHRNGDVEPPSVFYAFGFDRAAYSPTGRFAALTVTLGTKGLLLEQGAELREVDRSYYQADVYEFPLVLGRLGDGREVVVHCPHSYTRIDVDDLETGERLTARDPERTDVFHSRLELSPSSRWLLSAGWVWHPWDIVVLYDFAAALADPAALDRPDDATPRVAGEVEAATFIDDEHVLVATGPETLDDDVDGDQLGASMLGVWSISGRDWVSCAPLAERVGTIVPFGPVALSLYAHPKLVEVAKGSVVERWEGLQSGVQTSSIVHHHPLPPPTAVDRLGRRFAVASRDEVAVVELPGS